MYFQDRLKQIGRQVRERKRERKRKSDNHLPKHDTHVFITGKNMVLCLEQRFCQAKVFYKAIKNK